ncbi:MAG TPA: YqaA family protein [Candidatus Methylomirabilis sp.]|nr:YqaA family protein [Candidatus Methylomirabilis sp.]
MNDLSLWGLFLSAFVSATLFPGGSEVVLAVLALRHSYDPWVLLGVATLGNTLGGMSTWIPGWLLARRLPLDHPCQAHRRRAVERVKKWGIPLLLFSWLTVVGDPLCFAASWLRMNAALSACFIAAGKAARYAVILFAA